MLASVVWFIVAVGVLVTVHEFGHFWVARRVGVKILRFSVGFGRPLWRRRFGADGTEFVIAAVPLGGYVKMLDEREGPVPAAERQRAFNRQPLAARAAVVAAGPLANFAFAVLAYLVMYLVGVTGLKPVLGEVPPQTPAAAAGLVAGDEIVAVDGRPTPTWDAVLAIGMRAVVDGEPITVVARSPDGSEREVVLETAGIGVDEVGRGALFERLGLRPARPQVPAVIGRVMAGGAAQRAGLAPGDRVLAADGEPIADWGQWVEYVRSHPGTPIEVTVERDGRRLVLTVRPEPVTEGGQTIGRIGAAVSEQALRAALPMGVERYGPLGAARMALVRTWEMTTLTLKLLGRMLIGQASVSNLSGPLSIAQYAGESARVGIDAFLAFLAVVSISLGLINLMPVPILDGGHLLYYLIEALTGRPVSESMQAVGQQIGIALLLALMGLAFYNDIIRLLGSP